jgi:hypothetical protein
MIAPENRGPYFHRVPPTLTIILFTILLIVCNFEPIYCAVLDRFDSTFLTNDDYPGEGLYDLSLQFSHNPNRESTPQLINIIVKPPAESNVKNLFVKTQYDLRPVTINLDQPTGSEVNGFLYLREHWYHSPIYIRLDLMGIPYNHPKTSWEFTALLCSDLVNCYPGVIAKNVFRYSETVYFPKYSSSSSQFLTRWSLLPQSSKQITSTSRDESLFEIILSDAFKGVTDLDIFSSAIDAATPGQYQIDFFDIRFVGYYSFNTLRTERPINDVCFLNSIPVAVKPMGGAGRALRVYLSSTLTSDPKNPKVLHQIILNKRRRLVFTCDQNLKIKTDWHSGPYAYSVIKLGHRRETTSQTYEDIIYPHLFYRELTPLYSTFSLTPPPEIRQFRAEWNSGLNLLTQSFIINFKKESSAVFVPPSTTPTNDDSKADPNTFITWDTREYLLPDTNFTMKTVIEDVLFGPQLKFELNEKRQKTSKDAFSALFIAPVVKIPTKTVNTADNSRVGHVEDDNGFETLQMFRSTTADTSSHQYGPFLTYTNVNYEIPSGSPLVNFEFVNHETGSPNPQKPGQNWPDKKDADKTIFQRSSPISPYENFANSALTDLKDEYPVQFYQLLYLPNATFCSFYPLLFTRLQLESRLDDKYLTDDFRPTFSHFTTFHLSSHFNLTLTPGIDSVNPDNCYDISPNIPKGTNVDEEVSEEEGQDVEPNQFITQAQGVGKDPLSGKPQISNKQTSFSNSFLNLFFSQEQSEIIIELFGLDIWVQGWAELQEWYYPDEDDLDQSEQNGENGNDESQYEQNKNPNNDDSDDDEDQVPFSIEQLRGLDIDANSYPLLAEWQKSQGKVNQNNNNSLPQTDPNPQLTPTINNDDDDDDDNNNNNNNNNDHQNQLISIIDPILTNFQDSFEFYSNFFKNENNHFEIIYPSWFYSLSPSFLSQESSQPISTLSSMMKSTSNSHRFEFEPIPFPITNNNRINNNYNYQNDSKNNPPQHYPFLSTLSSSIFSTQQLSQSQSGCDNIRQWLEAEVSVFSEAVQTSRAVIKLSSSRESHCTLADKNKHIFEQIQLSLPHGKFFWKRVSEETNNSKKNLVKGMNTGNNVDILDEINPNRNSRDNSVSLLDSLFLKTDRNGQNDVNNNNYNLTADPKYPLRPRISVPIEIKSLEGTHIKGVDVSNSIEAYLYPQTNRIIIGDMTALRKVLTTFSTDFTLTGMTIELNSIKLDSLDNYNKVNVEKTEKEQQIPPQTVSPMYPTGSSTTCFKHNHLSSLTSSNQSQGDQTGGDSGAADSGNENSENASKNNNQALKTLFEIIPCPELWDKTHQTEARLRLDLRSIDNTSYLSASRSVVVLSMQNISPKKGLSFFFLTFPLIFSFILITISICLLSRRYDEYRSNRRAKQLQVETNDDNDEDDEDDGVDENGQNIRKKSFRRGKSTLLSQLRSEDGLYFYEDNDEQSGDGNNNNNNNNNNGNNFDENKNKDNNMITPGLTSIQSSNPKQSRYAAIAAAKAEFERQKAIKEIERSKMTRDQIAHSSSDSDRD